MAAPLRNLGGLDRLASLCPEHGLFSPAQQCCAAARTASVRSMEIFAGIGEMTSARVEFYIESPRYVETTTFGDVYPKFELVGLAGLVDDGAPAAKLQLDDRPLWMQAPKHRSCGLRHGRSA